MSLVVNSDLIFISLQAQDAELISWINQHIPHASHKATDMSTSLATGLVLYRLAESIKTSGDSDRGIRDGVPDVPDSIFPTTPNDEKLDGLFVLFDFLLDNDVRMGNVTINDVRSGDRDQLVVLVKALKSWEEKRRSMDNILVRQGGVAWAVHGIVLSWYRCPLYMRYVYVMMECAFTVFAFGLMFPHSSPRLDGSY